MTPMQPHSHTIYMYIFYIFFFFWLTIYIIEHDWRIELAFDALVWDFTI